jgi:hypothetical protein
MKLKASVSWLLTLSTVACSFSCAWAERSAVYSLKEVERHIKVVVSDASKQASPDPEIEKKASRK